MNTVNGEIERWLATAEDVARNVLAVHAAEVDDQARWPNESVQALGQSGLLGLAIPRSFGGAGQGPAVFAQVTEILAASCASTAMIYVMHTCATPLIACAAGFSQREEVLADIAAGRHLSTYALSEKGSRSHFWAPISQAVAHEDRVRISALKSWVTSAGHADSYVVSSRTAGHSDPTSFTLYYVPGNASGLCVSGPWRGMGLRGNASAPMTLEHVEVPAASRLCAEGGGLQTMMQIGLPWFQVGTAAASLGIARAAMEATRQHLLTSRFEHLGQSLASLMNQRARLAQMRILVDSNQALLAHAAALLEEPGPDTLLSILECKAAAAETALQVTDLAMRACGGAAFSSHLAVDRYFRDARAGSVMAPTTDVLYDLIAKSMLDMPLF